MKLTLTNDEMTAYCTQLHDSNADFKAHPASCAAGPAARSSSRKFRLPELPWRNSARVR